MECERRGLRADDRDRRREDCEAISTARCELIAASHFASRADHGEPITASQRSRWRQPARLMLAVRGALLVRTRAGFAVSFARFSAPALGLGRRDDRHSVLTETARHQVYQFLSND